MGRELAEAWPAARSVFDRVSAAVELDVAQLCFESDDETLRQTQNAQIALFTCGLGAFEAFRAETGLNPSALAGHSIGEYAALVVAGVLSLEEAARLVRRRAELMAEAGRSRPGTMAAVLGLDTDEVSSACAAAAGIVTLANDNSPGQIVISGEVEAVAEAGEKAKELGAKRVLPLNVSGAFHSPLMTQAAEGMREATSGLIFASPSLPVYANVTAAVETNWVEMLPRQLESPVRWRESVFAMRAAGLETFIEFGSGEVLTGLLKRIDPEARGLAVTDADSLRAVAEQMAGASV